MKDSTKATTAPILRYRTSRQKKTTTLHWVQLLAPEVFFPHLPAADIRLPSSPRVPMTDIQRLLLGVTALREKVTLRSDNEFYIVAPTFTGGQRLQRSLGARCHLWAQSAQQCGRLSEKTRPFHMHWTSGSLLTIIIISSCHAWSGTRRSDQGRGSSKQEVLICLIAFHASRRPSNVCFTFRVLLSKISVHSRASGLSNVP